MVGARVLAAGLGWRTCSGGVTAREAWRRWSLARSCPSVVRTDCFLLHYSLMFTEYLVFWSFDLAIGYMTCYF